MYGTPEDSFSAHELTVSARNSNFNVGLHDPIRILWILLRSAPANDLLEYGVCPSSSMYRHDSPNRISQSQFSCIPLSHVRRTWTLLYHPDSPQHIHIWRPSTNLADESWLDATYGYIQSRRSSNLRREGQSILITAIWSQSATKLIVDSREMVSTAAWYIWSQSSDFALRSNLCWAGAHVWTPQSIRSSPFSRRGVSTLAACKYQGIDWYSTCQILQVLPVIFWAFQD